jgi:osomolarity two-component system phosphorelay intermediate protein YPD1
LGHFLKGSSATLGLLKVKDVCQKIQHYGEKKDETGINDEPDEQKLLRLSEEALMELKEEYAIVEAVMTRLYSS